MGGQGWLALRPEATLAKKVSWRWKAAAWLAAGGGQLAPTSPTMPAPTAQIPVL